MKVIRLVTSVYVLLLLSGCVSNNVGSYYLTELPYNELASKNGNVKEYFERVRGEIAKNVYQSLKTYGAEEE